MTMARAIYRAMEVGKEYTTSEIKELARNIEFLPWDEDTDDWNKAIPKNLWKMVNTGYAVTRMAQETMGSIRGCQFGGTKVVYTTYNMRYWKRIK